MGDKIVDLSLPWGRGATSVWPRAGLMTDEVTGMRGTLSAFPLRYEGGDASPVRLVTILEE